MSYALRTGSFFRRHHLAVTPSRPADRPNFRNRFLSALVAFSFCFAAAASTHAQQTGSATGLPLPRYVSLKSDRVNLREGPAKDHRTTWVFQRAGLPVEITAEFETWRRIRDSEGSEGWVLHSLLSGRRTALVAPWKKGEDFPLYDKPSDDADIRARLQANVVANVRRCDGKWCRLTGKGYDGYFPQTLLWGVYPGEKVE